MELQWKVTLAGVDVSEDVEFIETIQNRLDIPRLTEYAVSDFTMTLMPNRYDYSPDKASNFFTDNGLPATGHRAPIEVEGGIRGETLTTLFKGSVVELQHVLGEQYYRLVATDASAELRNDTITDFGLRKNNTLRAVPEPTSIRGEFNFAEPVAPVSRESTSGTLGGAPLVLAQNLAEEGNLSELNYQLARNADGIETEVAPEDDSAVLNVTYRAPLRGVGIQRAVREILTHYGITSPQAVLPLMRTTNPHWSHIARPGYEVESASGTNNVPFGWNGYVTDMVVRPSNGDIYCLYSHHGQEILPQLLYYSAHSDNWHSLYQASAHAEWWQLATTDFNDFFIMQTTGRYERGIPRFGTYNPAEANQASPARTSILKLTVSNRATSVFAGSGNLRPQMSMHYWYGFIGGSGRLRNNLSRVGFLPDTRTGFAIAENALWYRYASSTRFGLARIRTSNGQGEAVITNSVDEFDNEASFDFTLDTSNRTIYASHTTIGETGGNLRSRHLVYSRAMPTSY